METIANKAASMRRRIIRDWVTYAVVCSFLVFVNRMSTPHHWWVLWVMAGWGVGIVLRTVFRLTGPDEDEH